jgi:hypothetical protein
MRKKSHPTTTELVDHNPTSNSYHQINYRKPTQIRLTGAQQRKKEVYLKKKKVRRKETSKEAVRTPEDDLKW